MEQLCVDSSPCSQAPFLDLATLAACKFLPVLGEPISYVPSTSSHVRVTLHDPVRHGDSDIVLRPSSTPIFVSDTVHKALLAVHAVYKRFASHDSPPVPSAISHTRSFKSPVYQRPLVISVETFLRQESRKGLSFPFQSNQGEQSSGLKAASEYCVLRKITTS